MSHKIGKGLSFGVAVLVMAGVPAGLQAQDISIVGDAKGCFGIMCVPSDADADVLSGVAISYTSNVGVDFTGITAGGQLAVNTAGTSTTGSFGSIIVGTATPATFVTTPFQLLLSFINPLTSSQVFDAVISGTVSVLGTGGILVDYDPAPGPANVNETTPFQFFSDPLTTTTGLLRTTAFGDAIPSGGTGELTGLIEVQANIIPEPASMLLLGTGLAGMLALRFRRRRREDAPLA